MARGLASMDTNGHEKLSVEIVLVELYRVRSLIEQGLAKPDEKSGVLQSAYELSNRFTDEMLRRKAQKLVRATVWTRSTHDGFVATDEAAQLDPWIALLEEVLENRPIQPTNLRFVKGQPASNAESLVGLLKGNTIVGVFDPFLDTRGVQRLLSLQRMGADLGSPLRCLTSGKADPIDDLVAHDVFKELKLQGEIRQTGSKEDHRRFLLLKHDKVLILGLSFNDFNKDEEAHIESSKYDHEFFERIWQSAQAVKTPSQKTTPPKTRPVVDFQGGSFSHMSGPAGRKLSSRLSNLGDSAAFNIRVSIESDNGTSEPLVPASAIPSVKAGSDTSEVQLDYTNTNAAQALLVNPRVVFRYADANGNGFESSRAVVQEARASGGYNLKAGDWLGGQQRN